MILQYIAAMLALIGLAGIRKKQLWGPIFAGYGSLFWVTYGVSTSQWGLVAAECVYLVMYISVFIEWNKPLDTIANKEYKEDLPPLREGEIDF